MRRIPRPPDALEPVVGWRAWTVALRGAKPPYEYFLLPFGGPHVIDRAWQAGVAVPAICTLTPSHRPPWPGCGCGYWALGSLVELMDVVRPVVTMQPSIGPGVIGTVNLWGKVAIHERGYRAEYAYPKELFIAGGLDPHLERTFVASGLERYGMRVRAAEDLGLVFDQRGCPGSHQRLARNRRVRQRRVDGHR